MTPARTRSRILQSVDPQPQVDPRRQDGDTVQARFTVGTCQRRQRGVAQGC